MKKIFILFFVIGQITLSKAQDISRVKTYLDTLCSPRLNGRGYVGNGDKLAAQFLGRQFKKIGLKSFADTDQDDYFQFFPLNVNTFPGKVSLKLDRKELKLGEDFIVSPTSGSGNGKVCLVNLDTTIFSDKNYQKKFLELKCTNKALVIPAGWASQIKKLPKEVQSKIFSFACLIKLEDKKLTASLAPIQHRIPEFEIKAEKLTGKNKRVSFCVEAMLKENYQSQNVIGYVPGIQFPDSFFVISAHYDHLGSMGTVYFPGANDNASGVSLLLELARYYKVNPLKYSVVFMAFGGEEAGLVGSNYYTNHPLFSLAKIRFLINLDLLGTGEEGIMVVNATKFPKEYEILDSLNQNKNYISAVKKRGPAANSDHYFFFQKGVPSFFIYTLGGISAYHDIHDRKETLPLTRFKEVFALLIDFLKTI